jgi:hypothetical protein
MDNVIPIRPPEPPTGETKKPRKPVERFSRVAVMLNDHQMSVYQACALLGAIVQDLRNAQSARLDRDERDRTTYALDGVLRLLTPVACIDSFQDLIQQDEKRRVQEKLDIRW